VALQRRVHKRSESTVGAGGLHRRALWRLDMMVYGFDHRSYAGKFSKAQRIFGSYFPWFAQPISE